MNAEHYIVYRERGIFAGWPANHGLWQRDGRLLVGFETGAMDLRGGFHAIDRRSPVTPMMAETLDGGETWECWRPKGAVEVREDRRLLSSIKEEECTCLYRCQTEPVDFHQQIAKFRMLDMNRGPSYVNYSVNCGRTWSGPWMLEGNEIDTMMDRDGVNARTSYLTFPQEPWQCVAFMSAAKASDGREGQPFCIETRDGGITWEFLSWIDDVPPHCFGIMPSAVRMPDGSVVCAVRWRERDFEHKWGDEDDPFENGIVVYRSEDECRTWRMLSIATYGHRHAGNPPDLVLMPDGRLVLVYGCRDRPYGIMYQDSSDGGETWGVETWIREDGGCSDLGYTRSAVRPDGKIVSVYYWNDSRNGERYIAATVWEP